MNPLSIGIGIAGFGASLYGGLAGAKVAGQETQVSENIAQNEQAINQQKNQQMQLQASRAQLQNFRNAQRLRAQATAASVQGGSQYGSGLGGGYGGISGQAGTNSLGINQNEQIGQNIFGLQNNISADKMQMAKLQGYAAEDQGISSLGGALTKAAPTLSPAGTTLFSMASNFIGSAGA
jgi:hypothetical protein